MLPKRPRVSRLNVGFLFLAGLLVGFALVSFRLRSRPLLDLKKSTAIPASPTPSSAIVTPDPPRIVLFSDLSDEVLADWLAALSRDGVAVVRPDPGEFENYKLSPRIAVLAERPDAVKPVLDIVLTGEERAALETQGVLSLVKFDLFEKGQMVSISIGPQELFRSPREPENPRLLGFEKDGNDPDPIVTARTHTGEPMVGGAAWADYAWVVTWNTRPTIKPAILKPGNGSRLPQSVANCTPPRGGKCLSIYVALPVFFSFDDFLQPSGLPFSPERLKNVETTLPIVGLMTPGGSVDWRKLIDSITTYAAPARYTRDSGKLTFIYNLYHRVSFATDPTELGERLGSFQTFRLHGAPMIPGALVVPTETELPEVSRYLFVYWILRYGDTEIIVPKIPKRPKQVIIFPQIATAPVEVTAQYTQPRPSDERRSPTPPPQGIRPTPTPEPTPSLPEGSKSASSPDLRCFIAARSSTPASAKITVEVFNYGLGIAGGSTAYWVFERTAPAPLKLQEGNEPIPPLVSSGRHTFDADVALPGAGTYTIDVMADLTDAVKELDETQNTCSEQFTVFAPSPSPSPSPSPTPTPTPMPTPTPTPSPPSPSTTQAPPPEQL